MESIKTEEDIKWLKHPAWIWMQFGVSKTWIQFWLWSWYEFWIWGLHFSSRSLCTFHFHPDVKKMCVDLRSGSDTTQRWIFVLDPGDWCPIHFKSNVIRKLRFYLFVHKLHYVCICCIYYCICWSAVLVFWGLQETLPIT